MQIHEITKAALQEGIFDAFKTPEKIAAQAAEKLKAQGYGQRKPLPAVQDSVAAVQKNPAQQQYIKGLVAQWAQVAPKASDPNWRQDALKSAGVNFPQSESKQRSKSKTSGKNSNWRQDALKSVGAAFDPPPAPRPAPGQMPALVAASKQGKLMLQAYGKPRGGIQDIDEAPQEYTTPGGIEVPVGTKTDQAPRVPVADNEYKDAFVKWAGEKLRTVDSVTRQTITLDQVNATNPQGPQIKDELDRALAQVVATAGDPAKNTVAVNNYLTIAVAGVARVSQILRQNSVYGATGKADMSDLPRGQAGQAIVTQQEIRNTLSQEVNLSNDQIEQLQKLVQNPASRAALLKSFGVTK
jgi:hypothetical protein